MSLAAGLVAIMAFSNSSASKRLGTSPKIIFTGNEITNEIIDLLIITRIKSIVNVFKELFNNYLSIREKESHVFCQCSRFKEKFTKICVPRIDVVATTNFNLITSEILKLDVVSLTNVFFIGIFYSRISI